MLTTGTFLSGLIHVGLRELRGRPCGRSAGEDAGRAAARAGAAGRAPEDRHAAAARRPHDRLLGARRAAGRRSRRRCSRFIGRPRDASAPAALLDHAHQRAHARDHPRRPRPLAAVHRRHRGRRSALLPVDRGQGRALRRARQPPDLPRARGPRARTRSTRTASRRRCPSTCSSTLVRSMRGCENAHILRPGYAIEYDYFDPRALKATLETKAIARALLRRADQRHDRLRGSGGAGPARRHQRGALRARRGRLVPAARRGLPRRAGRRPDHARRHRALPDVHLARRVPAAAARGQRRPAADRARAARSAWSTTRAGTRSRASATRSRASASA